jgi:hypothetical protein
MMTEGTWDFRYCAQCNGENFGVWVSVGIYSSNGFRKQLAWSCEKHPKPSEMVDKR